MVYQNRPRRALKQHQKTKARQVTKKPDWCQGRVYALMAHRPRFGLSSIVPSL
jgi:hypothetical protein